MNKLDQSTIEKLGHYVYLLSDPKTKKVFYVGKGSKNRVNHHAISASDPRTRKTEKIKTLRQIIKSTGKFNAIILRHGLNSETAFEIEAAMIDYLSKGKLTNLVLGHHSTDKEMMSLDDIKIKYEAKDAIFNEPVILINVRKLYHKDMSRKELYGATRKHWHAKRALNEGIRIACAVYLGIIREVFVVKRWLSSPKPYKDRVYFEGKVAPSDIRNRYQHKSVAKYWKQGNQNPIRYPI